MGAGAQIRRSTALSRSVLEVRKGLGGSEVRMRCSITSWERENHHGKKNGEGERDKMEGTDRVVPNK